MTDWTWSDPRWRDAVGTDLNAGVREAIRRAVHLRDTLAAEPRVPASQAVFLVDVLDHVAELLAVETADLWGRP